MIDFRSLVQVGIHFGHEKRRWCPKMAPYIWGSKSDVHLIDVSKTAYQLEKSAKFLEQVAREGKGILWIGTKKAAQNIIKETAEKLKNPCVYHRWVGGTLSNFSQVKKSVTKLLHFEDVVEKADQYPHYTKKEINTIYKNAERLNKSVGGIRNLNMPLGAIVIIDVGRERAALREAMSVGVPVVALVDTNCDPSGIDYVIPGNDDAPRAIRFVVDYLSDAAEKGQKEAHAAAKAKRELEAAAKEKEAQERAAKKAEAKGPKAKEAKAPAAKAKEAKAPAATEKKAEEKKVAAPKAAPKSDAPQEKAAAPKKKPAPKKTTATPKKK